MRKRQDILKQAFAAHGQNGEFPRIRFYLLHSLSHLLLTAISLECGYDAGVEALIDIAEGLRAKTGIPGRR